MGAIISSNSPVNFGNLESGRMPVSQCSERPIYTAFFTSKPVCPSMDINTPKSWNVQY
jgi:hypothetical protein